VKPQVENPALPGWACSRALGRENFGRGCSRPRGRETAVEAEVTQTRVAAEAEAGETRVHALSSQHTRGEGTRKHACLSEGKGGEMR
jgi:hypothetical protein